MSTKSGKFKASVTKGSVSYKLQLPPKPQALLVMAHGAGTDMKHKSMEDLAGSLAGARIGTFRFNFPYKESGKGGPNPKPVLLETIANAVQKARELCPKLPLYAGGKSMGGRMTSLLAAQAPIVGVKGLIYFGFPLHAVGRPSSERGDHLKKIKVPMLFLSGIRDTMGDTKLMKALVKKLGKKSRLVLLEGADHSFKVLKSGPKSYDDILHEVTAQVVRLIG